MSRENGSVVEWIERIHDGDSKATDEIWKQYYQRMVRLADRRMSRLKRVYDAEDAALSAMNSFFSGIQKGRFRELNSRHNLWKILAVITARTIARRTKEQMRQKRGGGNIRGESVFFNSGQDSNLAHGIHQVAGAEPTPEYAAALVDHYNSMLSKLDKDDLREYAELRLEGLTVEEIANAKGCCKRTVMRKLARIKFLLEQADGESG